MRIDLERNTPVCPTAAENTADAAVRRSSVTTPRRILWGRPQRAFVFTHVQICPVGQFTRDRQTELLQDAAQFLLHGAVARDGLARAGERDLGNDGIDPRCHVRNNHVKTVGFVLFDDLDSARSFVSNRHSLSLSLPLSASLSAALRHRRRFQTQRQAVLHIGNQQPRRQAAAGRAVIAVVSPLCGTVG